MRPDLAPVSRLLLRLNDSCSEGSLGDELLDAVVAYWYALFVSVQLPPEEWIVRSDGFAWDVAGSSPSRVEVCLQCVNCFRPKECIVAFRSFAFAWMGMTLM
jgi:hypothetical protein